MITTTDIILEVPIAGDFSRLPPPLDVPPSPPAPPLPPPRDPKVGQELASQIAVLFAHKSASERKGFTLLRRFIAEGWWGDQSARSPKAWLVWRLGLDYTTAAEWVRVIEKLATLPRIDEAFAKGTLSYTQVRHLTRVATPENEACLLQYARHHTGSQLAKICADVRRQLAAAKGADVSEVIRLCFKRHEDGTVTVSARMRAEQAATVERAIDLRLEERREEAPKPPQEDPGAPPAQLTPERVAALRTDRVAALVEVCERYVAGLGKHDTDVPSDVLGLVKIDLESLQARGAGLPRGECSLGDGTPLPLEAARRLLCDAEVVPALLKKKGGQPIDVGRRTRTVSKRMRLLLLDRDQGRCQFPGCGARGHLDAHHIEHWARGGETKLENLVLLCRSRHHVAVHEGGYSVTVADDGTLVFFDPQGRLVPRGPTLPALGEDAVERLKAKHRGAGIAIGPETNECLHDFSAGVDYDHCVAAVLDRTARSPYFLPQAAFSAYGIPDQEVRRLARAAPWFKDLPEDVQKRVG